MKKYNSCSKSPTSHGLVGDFYIPGAPNTGGAGGCWFGGAGNVCCGKEQFGGVHGKRLGDGNQIVEKYGKSWENDEKRWNIMRKTTKHVG